RRPPRPTHIPYTTLFRSGSDEDASARFLTNDPFSRRVTQLRILVQRQIALAGATHDRFSERVLGMLLGDGSGLEHVILCRVIDCSHCGHFGNSKRECAGFVENASVDAAELLEVKPTFRDDAATRSAPDSRQDGERRTGCYTTRTSDDDYRDSRSEIARDNKGERRRAEREVDQSRREPIGNPLHGR